MDAQRKVGDRESTNVLMVVNMLKVVWSDLVRFTLVDNLHSQNVSKHTQNKRFSLSTLWHMVFNMQSVLLCFTH